MYPRKQVPFNLNEYLEPVDPWVDLAKKLNNNYGPREDSPAEEPAVMGTPEMQGRGIASEDANLDTATPAPREAVEFTPEQEAEIARANEIAQQVKENQVAEQIAQDSARQPTQELSDSFLEDGQDATTRQLQTGLSAGMQKTGRPQFADEFESNVGTFRENLDQLSMDPWAKLVDFMAGKGKLSSGKGLEDKAAMQKERLAVYQGEKLTGRASKVVESYLDTVKRGRALANAFQPDGDGNYSAAKIRPLIGALMRENGVVGAQSDADANRQYQLTLAQIFEWIGRFLGVDYGGKIPKEEVQAMIDQANVGLTESKLAAEQKISSLEEMYLASGVSPEVIQRISTAAKTKIGSNVIPTIGAGGKLAEDNLDLVAQPNTTNKPAASKSQPKPAAPKGKVLNAEESAALKWANENPTDARSKEILKRLGR